MQGIILCLLLAAPGSVEEGLSQAGGDLYVFGNNLVIQGTVRGDVIAAGSSVTITGHVTGSVMAAGSTLVVSGPVDGSVRLAI